ncbi:MAG TPA: GGDEF domain-containing protein [Candidatus Dormibacteraeota bacterium]|nr:GGDEF domain-containing protein [Candidatus Dormibacteraeota bacterium]
MVMASWPDGRGRPGSTFSVESQRGADMALRRAVRRAAWLGASLLVGVFVLDSVLDLVEFGPAALPRVWVDVAVSLAVITIARMVSRARWAPQPAVLTALVLVFASMIVQGRVGPQAVGPSVAYMATLIVATGLFLPWDPRWHAGWLAAATGLSAAVVLVAPTPSFGNVDPGGVMLSLGAAALASGVGQLLVRRRLRAMLEQQFELRRVSRYAKQQDARVDALNRELTRTARLDTVTGIGNRRALDEALLELAGRRLAAVLLDLDHFKAFNDRNGHLSGDAALARIGTILRGIVRGHDLVFRYGGEEFLILVPGGDLSGATSLAERVRTAVEKDEQTGPWGLTMSAGVAVADRFNSTNPTQLLRRADSALYQAKRLGRNRVVVDGGLAAPASEMAAS